MHAHNTFSQMKILLTVARASQLELSSLSRRHLAGRLSITRRLYCNHALVMCTVLAHSCLRVHLVGVVLA